MMHTHRPPLPAIGLAAEHRVDGHLEGHRIARVPCSEDADAKQAVAALADGLGVELVNVGPVDVGPLDSARLTEPFALARS